MSATRITQLFPVWAVGFSAWAYLQPELWVPFKPWIVPLLSVVMFGMGLTLTASDFTRVARRPGVVALGTALQFLVMPLAGWAVARGLGLSDALVAGVVLVGCAPGGTASNVICYLARGDVALSITLTTVSTLLAVVATPALTWAYVGEAVPVPVVSMMLSVLKIIIAPVVLGGLINALFGRRLSPVKGAFPVISVAAIVVIIAIIVALNAGQIATLAVGVVAAVVVHNLVGLGLGYGVAAAFGYDVRTRRTLAIEVGMQNSGLAVALANQYFSAAAALPGAVFSIWHNLSGSALAGLWGRGKAATD